MTGSKLGYVSFTHRIVNMKRLAEQTKMAKGTNRATLGVRLGATRAHWVGRLTEVRRC